MQERVIYVFTYEINDLVLHLKNRFKTNNPFEIAEMCNIIIRYEPLKKVKGMYTIQERCSFIILNNKLDEDMERVVIFHEIGHNFLHKEYAATAAFSEHSLCDMTSKFEVEANTFAVNYLVEDKDIEEAAEDGYTSQQIACSMRVPVELIMIKLKDMNDRGYDLNVAFNPRSGFLGDNERFL